MLDACEKRKCRNKESFQNFPGMFESNELLGTIPAGKVRRARWRGVEKGFSEVHNHAWAGIQGSVRAASHTLLPLELG